MRYKITFSYDGTAFNGYQKQNEYPGTLSGAQSSGSSDPDGRPHSPPADPGCILETG